jgi:hypothetical protein
VKTEIGNQIDFALNLTSRDKVKSLSAGSYTLVVDAVWNKLATDKPKWKDIRVKVTAPGSFRFSKMNQQQGLQNINKFFTDRAIEKTKKKGTATDFPGEHSNAHRFTKARVSKDCWLGYMFTHNKQVHEGHPLKESVTLRLSGIDLLHPHFSERQGNM